MVQFAEYLEQMPKLHTWDRGKTWSTGGFKREHIEPFVQAIRDRFAAPAIIETGAGNSTIAFTFCNPSRITSICPDPSVFDRIKSWCSDNDVDTGVFEFVEAKSQWVLPDLAREGSDFGLVDAVLIDGDHG